MEDHVIENKAFRVILLGMEEIIGKNGLKSMLNYSELSRYIDHFPPNDSQKQDIHISEITRLDEMIEKIYGKAGARAILFQVGRMQAKWGLEENAAIADAAKAAMSQMSEKDRAKIILSYTSDTISKQLDTEIWVEETEDGFLYKDKAATHCFGRKSKEPVCAVSDGFLTGMVTWAVGEKGWQSKEIACIAMGEEACIYSIKRTSESA
jgi:predicted hydrocarbon binding protein